MEIAALSCQGKMVFTLDDVQNEHKTFTVNARCFLWSRGKSKHAHAKVLGQVEINTQAALYIKCNSVPHPAQTS